MIQILIDMLPFGVFELGRKRRVTINIAWISNSSGQGISNLLPRQSRGNYSYEIVGDDYPKMEGTIENFPNSLGVLQLLYEILGKALNKSKG